MTPSYLSVDSIFLTALLDRNSDLEKKLAVADRMTRAAIAKGLARTTDKGLERQVTTEVRPIPEKDKPVRVSAEKAVSLKTEKPMAAANVTAPPTTIVPMAEKAIKIGRAVAMVFVQYMFRVNICFVPNMYCVTCFDIQRHKTIVKRRILSVLPKQTRV